MSSGADPTKVRKQPKIIGYMAALYEKMSSESKTVDVNTELPAQVWEGRLIQTCVSVGIPEGYYKTVVDVLRKLGCIEVVKQGKRGTNPTVVILRYPPTEQMYGEVLGRAGWEGLTNRPTFDTIVGQVRDIQKRLGGMDIVGALENHEQRIAELETAVKGLRQENHNKQQNQ